MFTRLLLLATISLSLLISATAQADSLKTLLMPGKLIEAHSEYEVNCDNCHDTSSKKKQGQLCVQCHTHENILDDISNKTGFHGRLPSALRTDCKHCHTDHKGRSFDIVLLNQATFDHSKTDFLLDGAHKSLNCNSCHEKDKRHAEAPGTCYACHKDDDTHKGKQGKQCDDCHATSDWKRSSFDHDKNTDFPLKGAHKNTLCSACHINKEYKDTPDQCVSCHSIQDVHLKTFGKKCNQCHTTRRWDKARYDHNKETGFGLVGKHASNSCASCHKPGSDAGKTADRCIDCHRYDDHHKGKFGKDCKTCHTARGWNRSSFDHGKTDFPLTGNHKEVSCVYCHRGELKKEELPTDCYGCHKEQDTHDGKQGKRCGECHNTSGWRDSKGFDHDLSDFPLLGMHATTQCEECHVNTRYYATTKECNACHAEDDTHETRLGTDCESCHNPNSWQTWIFDHDKATRFKIDGSHEALGCYDCHSSSSDGKLEASADCISCHRADDRHRGQFGRNCEQCHNTTDFGEISLSR